MNAYQKSQAMAATREIKDAYGVLKLTYDLLDVALAEMDLPFEYWDNIATDIYTNKGYTLTDNTPDNEVAFEDAQNAASELIIKAYNESL